MGAQRVDRAIPMRDIRGENLPARPRQRCAAGRPEDDGQGDPLTEDCRRQVSVSDICQDPRGELDRLEISAVGRHRQFVAGAAIDEVEDWARQPSSRDGADLIDVHWLHFSTMMRDSDINHGPGLE
jgi:hypothetical protein